MTNLNPLSRSDIIDLIEVKLYDVGNAVWKAPVLGTLLNAGLKKISRSDPLIATEELTTTVDVKELDLSDIKDLIKVRWVEFRVDQTPRQYCNFWMRGRNTLVMKIDFYPAADEDVNVFCEKHHHLDPDWIASTDYVLGDVVSPTTDNLNGFRYKCTTAGTSNSSEPTWGTTAGGTTSDNSATWTAIEESSRSLSEDLEQLLVDLVASQAAMGITVNLIDTVPIGKDAIAQYRQWGRDEYALVLAELKRRKPPNTKDYDLPSGSAPQPSETYIGLYG